MSKHVFCVGAVRRLFAVWLRLLPGRVPRLWPGLWPGLLPCLLLASCSVLGSKPHAPLHIYTLNLADSAVPAPAQASQPKHGPVILVEIPTAVPAYDSTHMVYVRQPQTQEFYANSAWADTPARLLAPLLATQLQQSGVFGAVLLAPSAARSDLRLDTTILRLEQDFLQTPSVVRLDMQFTLMDSGSHTVLAWRRVHLEQTAVRDDARGGAQASNAAVQAALREGADFLRGEVRGEE
ncbi:MAG: ABC-type transport auxiliary lipoprotein family protein [Rhodoferax sp.]|nr:ABC-type transport auxiliary lipoprotein family protein [Rhodoferax sp.]